MIAHARVEFLGAGSGGFNPALYGTTVGFWDADDGDWTGAATSNVSKVPSRYSGGPDLKAWNTTNRSASGWSGLNGGAQITVAKGTTDQLFAKTASPMPSLIFAAVWELGTSNVIQVIGAFARDLGLEHELHWFSSLNTPISLVEVRSCGNAGSQSPAIPTSGRHVVIMTMSSNNFAGYVDGALVYTWNGLPCTIGSSQYPNSFSYGNYGIQGATYGVGAKWRAGVLYSSLTTSVAALSAALAAQYL